MRFLELLPFGLAFGLSQVSLQSAADSDLVRRLKARELKAMSELYDRYGRIAYSIIFHVVRNPAIAEDLVQETFIRVWNRMETFDGEHGALGAWVLTVARNRAVEYLRSIHGRPQAGVLELEKLDRPGFFISLESNALSIDQMRRVKAALERLSPGQKSVIELAYYEGLSQTEMAEKLNQPLSTIKTWTHTALKILRDELGEAAIA